MFLLTLTSSTAHLVNHPIPGLFEANVYYLYEGGKVNLYANVPISPGDELFGDYGPEYFKGRKHGAMSKDQALAKYASKYDNGSFGWNLRPHSGALEEILPWVIKAQKIADDKREEKKKKK